MRKSELRQLIKEEISSVLFNGEEIAGIQASKVGNEYITMKTTDGSIFKGKRIHVRVPQRDGIGTQTIIKYVFKADDITSEFEDYITSIKSTIEKNGEYTVDGKRIEKIFKPGVGMFNK